MLRTALLDDSNTTAEMATNTKMEMPGGDNGQGKRSKSRGQSVVDGVRRMYDELIAHNRAFRCWLHTSRTAMLLLCVGFPRPTGMLWRLDSARVMAVRRMVTGRLTRYCALRLQSSVGVDTNARQKWSLGV